MFSPQEIENDKTKKLPKPGREQNVFNEGRLNEREDASKWKNEIIYP